MSALPLPAGTTPADLARAIVALRAQGRDKEADYLESHLPPSANHSHDAPAPQPAPDNDASAPNVPSAQPAAGATLNRSGPPRPDNAIGAGALPPRFGKAYDHTQERNADGSWGSEPVATDPDAPHSYGCVYLSVPDEIADRILMMGRLIPDADLAEDGRDTEIHVTALYGLKRDAPEPVYRILREFRPIRLTFGTVSAFTTPDYDVLKVDVESAALRRLHTALRRLPHTLTHRDFLPHCTIGYLKPGLGAIYAARFAALDASALADTAVFSTPDKVKYVVPLGRKVQRTEKAWRESEHPRRDDGAFTSAKDIRDATRDPAKAAELRASVTEPGEKKKLDALLAADNQPLGGTARANANYFEPQSPKFHDEEGHEHVNVARGDLIEAVKRAAAYSEVDGQEEVAEKGKRAQHNNRVHWREARTKALAQFRTDFPAGGEVGTAFAGSGEEGDVKAAFATAEAATGAAYKKLEDAASWIAYVANDDPDVVRDSSHKRRKEFEDAYLAAKAEYTAQTEAVWKAVEAARDAFGGKEKGWKLGRYFKAMSYLASSDGGALVAPAAAPRKRKPLKLRRPRRALAPAVCKATETPEEIAVFGAREEK